MTNRDGGQTHSELTHISSKYCIAATHPAGSLEFFGLQNSPARRHARRRRESGCSGPGSIFRSIDAASSSTGSITAC